FTSRVLRICGSSSTTSTRLITDLLARLAGTLLQKRAYPGILEQSPARGTAVRPRGRSFGAAQREHHGRAAPRGVLDEDLAPHRLYESSGDCQAEPDAVGRHAAPVAEALEGLEDAVTVGHGDAGPLIDHPQVHPVTHLPGLDTDGASRWGPRKGVVDDVGNR